MVSISRSSLLLTGALHRSPDRFSFVEANGVQPGRSRWNARNTLYEPSYRIDQHASPRRDCPDGSRRSAFTVQLA